MFNIHVQFWAKWKFTPGAVCTCSRRGLRQAELSPEALYSPSNHAPLSALHAPSMSSVASDSASQIIRREALLSY